MPYSLAALRVIAGDYGKFGRNRQEENLQKFNLFFSSVLEQVDRHGPTLLLAEAETVAHKLSALQNGKLEFDTIQIGNATYSRETLPNLRIVRTSPDSNRQPHYYHDGDQKTTQGFFSWGNAKRTFYGLKKTPRSVSIRSKFATQASRHLSHEDNRSANDVVRPISQVDEICVTFMQSGDDAFELALVAHRLRAAHAQYDDETREPFPLHELRLLGRGATF